jgi:hypothetical protein
MFHTVPYMAGDARIIVRCNRGTPPAYYASTLGKESPRGTLPNMTILVVEIAGVVASHTADPKEGRK